MSDGTRKKSKLKLSPAASKKGSPQASRAGSPERGAGDAAANPGAAATGKSSSIADTHLTCALSPSSVAPLINHAPFPTIEPFAFPTSAELLAHVPPGGIRVGQLMKCFPGAAQTEQRKKKITEMIRAHLFYDKASKLLKPRVT